MRFGVYTDSHLIGVSPEKRIDDYPKTILGKIDECYEIFQKNGADFALFGGDMFHSHRIYSYDVLSDLIDIIIGFGKKTYFIIGQHDLYGYNKDTYEKSTLRFIEKRSNGFFELVEKNIERDDCIIHACHVFDDVKKELAGVGESDKFQIMLVHELLTNKSAMYDIIPTKSLPDNNVNLVLSGDLHDGYDFHQVGNTFYYNPGSLARTKNNKVNSQRKVKCGVFNIDDNKNIDIKEFELKSMLPCDEVFKKDILADVDNDYSINVEGFVNEIEKLDVETIEIFELVKIIGKQTEQNQSLIDYILKFRSESDE